MHLHSKIGVIMLSYKNWKNVNENFGSRMLGISVPQSLGFLNNMHTEVKAEEEPEETNVHPDGEMVDPAEKKDQADGPKKCKYCGKKSKKMKKEDYDHDGEESYEDHDEEESYEDHDEEDHDEEDHDEEDHDEEDHDEEDHDEEDHDEEDHDEEDHDGFEESKHHKGCECKKCMSKKSMKCMKCEATTHKKKKTKVKSKDVVNDESMEDMVKRLVKKGMPEKFAASIAKKKFGNKKSKVKSKDVAGDESMEDMVKRLVKKGMPEKFAASIAKKKFGKTKNESWMRGIFGADPSKKFFDGIS